MRDFLPQDKIKRERLIATVMDSYIARGFQQIETPVLEDLDRLTSGQGGDNEACFQSPKTRRGVYSSS